MQERAKPNNLIEGATGEWEVVIGMEVHAQVTSNAKLFSGASTEFGAEPNSQVSLVDAAMPGMLPVPNAEGLPPVARTGRAVARPPCPEGYRCRTPRASARRCAPEWRWRPGSTPGRASTARIISTP